MSKYKIIALCGCIAVLAACSPAATPPAPPTEDADQIVIGYGAPELSGGQGAIMEGLRERAEAKGWQVQVANANSDSEVQAEQIDRFISTGVDAIVVVPIDSEGICESVEKANEAGIPFYTIDRAPTGCAINMTVLADNFGAGVQAGEALVALLTERYGEPRGTLLELQGDLRQNVAQLRGGGFHEVLDQYPDIEIISRETLWQSDAFADFTTEIVGSQDIDGIYMHSDCIGVPVILPLLEQMDKKLPAGEDGHIFLAGVDGCAETLQAIRDGFADQSSSQPLTDFGIIVDWVEKELNGETIASGPVTQDGQLWSPAEVQESETGLQLLLSTASVTTDNASLDGLWGNR